MKCINCGKVNLDELKFCSGCGFDFKKTKKRIRQYAGPQKTLKEKIENYYYLNGFIDFLIIDGTLAGVILLGLFNVLTHKTELTDTDILLVPVTILLGFLLFAILLLIWPFFDLMVLFDPTTSSIDHEIILIYLILKLVICLIISLKVDASSIIESLYAKIMIIGIKLHLIKTTKTIDPSKNYTVVRNGRVDTKQGSELLRSRRW